MRITLHRTFIKYIERMPRSVRERFIERKELLIADEFHPLLHNHKLHGTYDGYRSINITGDVRAVFYKEEDVVIFIKIGTHSELYEE